MEPLKSAGMLTIASTITRPANASPAHCTFRHDHAAASAFTPMPSNTALPSATSGTARAVLRSARPKLDDSRERLEHAAERRRVVVGVRTDRDHEADEEDEHEERAVPPPHDAGSGEREERRRVARRRSAQRSWVYRTLGSIQALILSPP